MGYPFTILFRKIVMRMDKKRHAKIYGYAMEMFRKSFELANAGKRDEAMPLAKSGKEYMQKHLSSFNINEQMLADFDDFFHKNFKSNEFDLPQISKIIEEYIGMVKPKLGDDTAQNLAMYIYLFYLELSLTAWTEVLKPYRTKTVKEHASFER